MPSDVKYSKPRHVGACIPMRKMSSLALLRVRASSYYMYTRRRNNCNLATRNPYLVLRVHPKKYINQFPSRRTTPSIYAELPPKGRVSSFVSITRRRSMAVHAHLEIRWAFTIYDVHVQYNQYFRARATVRIRVL